MIILKPDSLRFPVYSLLFVFISLPLMQSMNC